MNGQFPKPCIRLFKIVRTFPQNVERSMNVMRHVWKNVRSFIDSRVRFTKSIKNRTSDPPENLSSSVENRIIERVWDQSVGVHVWIHIYSAIPIDRLREAVGIKCS